MQRMRVGGLAALGLVAWLGAGADLALSGSPAGGALQDPRILQDDIAAGRWKEKDLQVEGLRMFASPFTRPLGYGDGPYDPDSPLLPGRRPTLQGNGTFLRVNGLDGQSCIDCHSVVSAATVPPTFGVGGVGSPVANAMFRTQAIMAMDQNDQNGAADFDGRFINPPFLFGAGAIELLGLEMTMDLQGLADEARANPGVEVSLVTKGVSFGVLVADEDGDLDTSGVVGVDGDLVVRPFGRKGDFPTTRSFDLDALMFHFGMQPTEIVGEDVDGDADGVMNEVMPGEVSALGVFVSTLEACRQEKRGAAAERGYELFHDLGCAACHVPALETRGRTLPLRFPERPTAPFENVYYEVQLDRHLRSLEKTRRGGLVVPLFADLKRHDMGPRLAESFHQADSIRNASFTTARLWGVADTAPYLHDGRATTLEDAILFHGGEAQDARDAFAALLPEGQEDLLAFLRTLRTPQDPAQDLVAALRQASEKAWKRRAKDEARGDGRE